MSLVGTVTGIMVISHKVKVQTELVTGCIHEQINTYYRSDDGIRRGIVYSCHHASLHDYESSHL